MKLNDSELATSSLQALFWNPYYWIKNEMVYIVLLVISVLLFILFFDINFPNDDPLNLISVAIYFFGIWGIAIVGKTLINLNIEKAIAKRITVNLGVELSKIRGKEKDKIVLDRILDLFPATSPKFSSAMIRLTNYIVQEAKDRKFYSHDVVTRTYKEETYKDIFKINSAQKIALRLGILGTFIGLIYAFVNLGDVNNMDQNFNRITEALQYAFSTSVAGLQVSVFLALFSLLLNKRREEYFKLMEDSAQVAISLSRNSINKDAFLASFDQMKESLEDVRDSVYDQQAETRAQTEVLKNGIGKLQNVNKDFDKFLANISSEMVKVYEILSPEKLSKELKDSMERSVKGISSVLNSNLSSQIKQYDKFMNNMHQLGNNLDKIEKQLKGQIQLNDKNLAHPKNDAYEAIKNLSIMQKDYLKQIKNAQTGYQMETFFKNLKSELKSDLNQKSDQLFEAVAKLERSLSSYSEIIESKLPRYSKGKVVFWSFFVFSCLGAIGLYVFAPSFFNQIVVLVKSFLN